MGKNNGRQQQATKERGKMEEAEGFDDVFDQPLVSTDLPDGQYPARLAGYTPVFLVPSKFDKSGKAPRFKFLFSVRNPQTGHVVILQSKLLTPPSRQANGGGVHSKSNLYEILRPLAGDDQRLWDLRADTIKSGTPIKAFVGCTSNVVVERDEGGYSHVTQVVVAPAGTTFPTAEETADALRTMEENAEAKREQESRGGRSDDGPPIDDGDERDTRLQA